MIIRELVQANRSCFHKFFDTWQEAIRASCQPLINDGSIENVYVDNVIECVNKYGPYIVLAPDIALPHAQEGGEGVNQNAISFMKVEEPVVFDPENADKNARLFFVLASNDHDKHIEMMEKLAAVLLNRNFVDALLGATCNQDLLEIDSKFDQGA